MNLIRFISNWMNKKYILLCADMAADVAHMKMTTLCGDIWDRHMSNSVHVRACARACVNKDFCYLLICILLMYVHI